MSNLKQKIFTGHSGQKWTKVRNFSGGGQSKVIIVKKDGDMAEYVLKIAKLNRPKNKERFINEIQVLNSLSPHPNIISLIDYSIENELWYIMPKGSQNLSKYLESNPISLEDKVAIFLKIIIGLKFLHSQENPIIHRDLKPQNILMFDENEVKLADFGLAILEHLEDENRKTDTKMRVGSYYYMAPEFEIGRVDQLHFTSDFYGLGKIWYFILSNGNKHLLREKFRDDDFSLSEQHSDHRYSLYNPFFDITIQENPNLRADNYDKLFSSFYNCNSNFYGKIMMESENAMKKLFTKIEKEFDNFNKASFELNGGQQRLFDFYTIGLIPDTYQENLINLVDILPHNDYPLVERYIRSNRIFNRSQVYSSPDFLREYSQNNIDEFILNPSGSIFCRNSFKFLLDPDGNVYGFPLNYLKKKDYGLQSILIKMYHIVTIPECEQWI